jgi:ubiquinone biosynthesis protein
MPELIRDYLTLATRGRLELRIASDDLKAIERRVARGQRSAVWISLAASMLFSGALATIALAGSTSVSRFVALVAIGVGVFALAAALRK